MIEISPFKEFFSLLSLISPLNFEVWDGKGCLFTSDDGRSKMPGDKEIGDLSARIIRCGTFQHASSQGRYAIFGAPIKNEEATVGSLIACGPNYIPSFLPFHLEQMEALLTNMTSLVEDRHNSQKEIGEMAERLTESFETLHLYSQISTQIKTLKFSTSMLKDLTEEILETMRVDLVFAELPDRREYSTLVSHEGISDKIPDQNNFVARLIDAIPPSAHSILKEGYFIVNDSSSDPVYRELHPEPYRFLAVKMQHSGELYGWLGLVSFNLEEIFQRSELRLLGATAEQIAVVIENTDLYQNLERFVINMVKSLVNAIEAKDVYTRGHSERVNRYSMLIAERLGIEESLKSVLHWASILHDIGKIGIPETVLNKPDRLTDEEYNIIKSHPKKGCEILQPIEQLLDSLPGILHHHERYDGKGYPQGLEGEEIPLLGRMIAIADTFDAITSDRAYRPGRAPEEAVGAMEQVAGTQLDPKLFEVFKEIYLGDLGLLKEGERGK
jgi:HD-GYP domain-containing protein (c-di-GMP phosphodiesterase class II)